MYLPSSFSPFESPANDEVKAVNALEGRIFNGNTITALFYDTETFEQGIYDK